MALDLAAALNPEQREAVEYTGGPLMILAGAGSGKTRVVTWRIAHLVARGEDPRGIVALSFTNRAAREMKERVAELAGSSAADVTISTFHSACARWLRQHARRVGLGRGFTIYDDEDQRSLLRQLCQELGLAHDASSVKDFQRRIESAKNAALRVREVETSARNGDDERFADLFAAYDAALIDANACDFGDLIVRLVHLLEDDDPLRESFRRTFTHLMVDEFQDTNVAQYRLLQQLATRDADVAVVGDDDQAIYRWRGATVENVVRFRDDYACHVVKLEQNYRSSPVILDAAHRVVEQLPARMDKKLRTAREDRDKVVVFVGRDDREEADFVVRQIERERIARDLRYDDFAIFFRTNAQSRVFEERMRMAGQPFEVVGGVGFYQRREVKDVLAYARLAVNPADEVAFFRIANVPSRGIGKTTLSRLIEHRRASGAPTLREALTSYLTRPGARLQARSRAGVQALAELLGALERIARAAGPDELLETVLTETGYIGWLEESEPDTAEDRQQNLDDLVASARDAADAGADLQQFLEDVSLRATDDTESDGSRVQMMTVHAAKGLEFPVVFVTGLEAGQFPLSRRSGGVETSDPDEERRLCYVAYTRAEDRLYLSGAMRRRLYGRTSECDPSEFLVELDPTHYEMADGSAAREPDWRGAPKGHGGGETAPRGPRFGAAPEYEFDQRSWQERYGEPVPDAGVVFDDSYFPQGTVDAANDYVGKLARHKTFGDGRIVAADPTGDRVRLTIEFVDVGRKKVVASYVDIVD